MGGVKDNLDLDLLQDLPVVYDTVKSVKEMKEVYSDSNATSSMQHLKIFTGRSC